jgi:CO dehydrogenase/acetyl-CoA synthase gamma subunit (corrinoid Fe-S protein)
MRYKIELKYAGRTIHSMKTDDMSEQELEEKKISVLDQFAKNRFTRNLALEVVATPL